MDSAVERLTQLPEDFDINLIGDDSKLPAAALSALRELAFRRAQTDRVWFLRNFWHIIDPQSMGWMLFDLRPYQVEDARWIGELIETPRSRAVVGKARQIGWTTLGCGLAFHDAYFNSNHKWLIASQGESEAKIALAERIKAPYNKLPLWFRDRGPALLDDNSEQMSFDNGSVIKSIPATSKAGRSQVSFGVLFDEAAFVDDADDLYTALDPQTYGPLIVFSTGNGMGNFFHKRWVDSQLSDSNWQSRFRPWHVVPERDEKWYEREKRDKRGELWRFYQEYPASPDEMFAKTGRAALPIDLLKEEQDLYVPELRLNMDLAVGLKDSAKKVKLSPFDLESVRLGEHEEADNELWVWEEPLVETDPKTGRLLRSPNYVVACDIAEGLDHGDRTSITVWNANTMEAVAAYRGHYPIEDLGEMLDMIGRWYHIALLMPERNNAGILPIDHLRRLWGYPRIYRIGPLASIPKGEKTPRYGWVTTKATKPLIVNEFIKALRNGSLAVHDPRFLEEAQTFIADGKGGFAASGANFDDHVMGHLIGWKGVLEVGQFPVVWEHDGPRPVTFGDLMSMDEGNTEATNPMDAPIGNRQVERPQGSWTWM